jgi:hypothetical protein
MAASTVGPSCWERQSIFPRLHRIWLTISTVAVCGIGSALSTRFVPCACGIDSRWRWEANRVRCRCSTAFGTPVVPEVCVMTTGSSWWWR